MYRFTNEHKQLSGDTSKPCTQSRPCCHQLIGLRLAQIRCGNCRTTTEVLQMISGVLYLPSVSRFYSCSIPSPFSL